MATAIKASVQSRPTPKDNLLRNALRGNALFSIVSAGVLLIGAEPVAEMIGLAGAEIIAGLDGAGFLRVIGLGLLLWVADIMWIATRPKINNSYAWMIIGGDLLWIVGSVVLLLTQALPFNTTGSWAVFLIADAVLMFAIAQYLGIRRNVQ